MVDYHCACCSLLCEVDEKEILNRRVVVSGLGMVQFCGECLGKRCNPAIKRCDSGRRLINCDCCKMFVSVGNSLLVVNFPFRPLPIRCSVLCIRCHQNKDCRRFGPSMHNLCVEKKCQSPLADGDFPPILGIRRQCEFSYGYCKLHCEGCVECVVCGIHHSADSSRRNTDGSSRCAFTECMECSKCCTVKDHYLHH